MLKKSFFLQGIIAIFLIGISFGCGGREKTDREPKVLTDKSVYGEQGSKDMEEVNIQSESTDYQPDRTSVDSESMDIIPDSQDQLPEWSPVYFAFDQSQLTEEAQGRLTGYGELLSQHPNWRILIEGHCDSRGTEAYNQALGERRAEAVRRFLLQFGAQPQQMGTISYGELKPAVMREDEEAWALNRRAEFRIQK